MGSTEDARQSNRAGIAALLGRGVYGLALLAVGVTLAAGGVRLLSLGGSPYYLPAGIFAATAGFAVLFGHWRTAGLIYLILMAFTLPWAYGEAGLDGWALAPRVIAPAVMGLPFLIGGLFRGRGYERPAVLAVIAIAVVLVFAVSQHSRYQAPLAAPQPPVPVATAADDDWSQFGGDAGGLHFSPLSQIDRSNVGQLKVAWRTSIGPFPHSAAGKVETVPLKVGNNLYVCTPFNNVVDLNPETGKVLWRFDAKPRTEGIYQAKCRGVAYYAVPGAVGPCAQRVYTSTADGRLIALDAATGALCQGFGAGGQVDLLKGMCQRSRGYYDPTSAPTLVRGKLLVGGSVADGQYVGEPSGAVRAYDAVTGRLAWVWDLGNPGHHEEVAPGQCYTPTTPNVWGPMSFDETLGLIYAPTGNSTPDYWAGYRSPQSNRYSSSVVAIDAETGEPRWSFQTTHYDIWDYDVAAQPMLFDLKTAGGVVPAVLESTKRGELFVLDRRTGQPLFPVVEKPAPQRGAVERISPTQPWSVAFPHLGGPRLTERSMWGITPIDQLWCRIKFREARYDGPLTPPGLNYSIADPGYMGGNDWGGGSIDPARHTLFIYSNRMVNHIRLVPRSDPIARNLKASSTTVLGGLVAQEGTPYAADIAGFLSPLVAPCQAPPYGLINAIDVQTGKTLWSRPLGSAHDMGPKGIASHLPFTIGTFEMGGPLSTGGGLVFTSGSQDHTLRAFDSATGKLLFEGDMPGAAWTKPVTYRSSGRQFVAVSSDGGHFAGSTTQDDGFITAFALPK